MSLSIEGRQRQCWELRKTNSYVMQPIYIYPTPWDSENMTHDEWEEDTVTDAEAVQPMHDLVENSRECETSPGTPIAKMREFEMADTDWDIEPITEVDDIPDMAGLVASGHSKPR